MAVDVSRPKKVSSEFALNQLIKQGWQDGKGLGREEQGIKQAIKVSGKNDKQGLGVDQSEQFVFHWWDHVFNKVASSIKVEDAEGEVKLSKDESSEKLGQISSKKPTNTAKGKELLYGRFIRSGTCHESDAKIATKSDESSEDESQLDFSNKDTLEKVFKLSGGRTAHKAARHGHKLNGKLKRLEEQERNSPFSTPQGSPKRSLEENVDIGLRKEGKSLKRGYESSFQSSIEGSRDCVMDSYSGSKKKRKSKKEDFRVSDDENCDASMEGKDALLVDNDNSVKLQSRRSKKKKKHSHNIDLGKDSVVEGCFVYDGEVGRKKKKKKKKKSKEDEENDTNASDRNGEKKEILNEKEEELDNVDNVDKALLCELEERHKKKSKKKQSKEMEENDNDVSDDKICKTRKEMSGKNTLKEEALVNKDEEFNEKLCKEKEVQKRKSKKKKSKEIEENDNDFCDGCFNEEDNKSRKKKSKKSRYS